MRTARVGSGPVPRGRLQSAPLQVKYSHTTFESRSISTMREWFESVISGGQFFSRLAKATPLTGSLMVGSPLPYCQTMVPPSGGVGVTSNARLLFSSQIRTLPLDKSSAQFGLLSWLAPLPETP